MSGNYGWDEGDPDYPPHDYPTFADDYPTFDDLYNDCSFKRGADGDYCDMHPPGYHDVRKSRKDCEVCGEQFSWIQASDDPERWFPGDFPVSVYESGKKVIQDVRDRTKWKRHLCKVKEMAK